MKKNANDEKSLKTGNHTAKTKGRGSKHVSDYDKVFMQLLRSQKVSVPVIAEKLGYCETTIYAHTEDTTFPQLSLLDMLDITRQLLSKALMDAYTDRQDRHREFALVVAKYTETYRGLVELQENIEIRDYIIVLEDVMTTLANNGVDDQVLEQLQAMYDEKREMLLSG